jgi:Flp pilus assembly protein TadB
MNDEPRKPALERLFASANRDLADEAFVARVMAGTRKLRTRNLVVALAICVAAAPVAWLVADPLYDTFVWLAQLLSQPLVRTSGGIASAWLPINTIGGGLALTVLTGRAVVRRVFSEAAW